jgi:hypothetical protein
MRIAALSLLALWTLTVAGCQNKAAKMKLLPGQYSGKYPAYAKEWHDETTGLQEC